MCVAQQHLQKRQQRGPTVTALLVAKVKLQYKDIFTNLESLEGAKLVLNNGKELYN